MRTYFTASATYERPEPHHTLCLQSGAVTLQQRARDRFTVRYGKQVETDLDYDRACARLGGALMHQAACEGMLDNREKGER